GAHRARAAARAGRAARAAGPAHRSRIRTSRPATRSPVARNRFAPWPGTANTATGSTSASGSCRKAKATYTSVTPSRQAEPSHCRRPARESAADRAHQRRRDSRCRRWVDDDHPIGLGEEAEDRVFGWTAHLAVHQHRLAEVPPDCPEKLAELV